MGKANIKINLKQLFDKFQILTENKYGSLYLEDWEI
jgi:hypothetical protein